MDRDHFHSCLRLAISAFLGSVNTVLSSDLHTLQKCLYNIAVPMTEPFPRILGRVALISRARHFFIFAVIIQQVTLRDPLPQGSRDLT